jgi:hypothetical protein
MFKFNNPRKDYSIRPPKQAIANNAFYVIDSANIDFAYNTINKELTANLTKTGVIAGTYGSSTIVPVITLDIYGRITGVTTATIPELLLQTNSVDNPTQTILNLIAGTNMTITDDGLGNITFDSTGGSGGTYTADNGITETTNNFQLGGPLVLNTVISGATRAYGIDFSELSYITGTTDQLNVVADNGIDNTQLDISGGGGQIIHTNTVAGSQSAVLLQSSTAALQQISAASGGSIQFTSAFGLFGYYHTPVLTQVQYQVEINSVGIHVVTPNVQALTASVGQVLTLQNATTGQVEFQTSTAGGGGGGRSYYLNGSVVQGTFGGITDMRQMSPVPVIGTGADFQISSNGYIKSFITDAGDPNKAVIPAGNWNFELWFSANNGGGSPSFYVELSKYDTVGGTFTPISTSSTNPEGITNGTAIDLYFTALSVPQTTLALTDRLAVRVFVNNSGRTITLHTQGPHLSQIITDFPSGIVSLNGLTAFTQNFATPGTTGLTPNWVSSSDTHTLNIPLASTASVTAGLISNTDYTAFKAGSCGVIFTAVSGVITNGTTGYAQVPYDGTITGWTLVSTSASGSCTVTVFKDAFANYPPTSPTDNIFTVQPALVSQIKNQNLSPTFVGSQATVAAGDWIGFTISGVALVSWVNLTLSITKT